MGRRKVRKTKGHKGLNRSDVKKGDLYTITNDVEVADVDGDGVADVTVKHLVTKNGAKFTEATVIWYGITDPVVDAFVDALDEAGLVDDEVLETNKFGRVAKVWKDISKFLKKINDLAEVQAEIVDKD